MKKVKSYFFALSCALAFFLVFANSNTARAQEQDAGAAAKAVAVRPDVNQEVQLYLLSASNEQGLRTQLPSSMDGVLKQLKASLPFTNFRLATTFLNRVKDGGTLEVSGVGTLSISSLPGNSTSPTFYRFTLERVKLATDSNGQQIVQIPHFRFSLRVPIQTASVRPDNSASGAGFPVIQYEDTGISTEMSVREGEPTVVGTITTSRPDELFVLVISVKRTAAR
ncbi:MAG: hypothetical protein LC754_00650 [Acidobacteria bacterium]|nr:hypothetical protein [Acidobacteriota bacterium]